MKYFKFFSFESFFFLKLLIFENLKQSTENDQMSKCFRTMFLQTLPRFLCMRPYAVGIVEPSMDDIDTSSTHKSINNENEWKYAALVCERFFAILYFLAILVTLFATICTFP